VNFAKNRHIGTDGRTDWFFLYDAIFVVGKGRDIKTTPQLSSLAES
jgi:hypothetical protein